MKKHLLLGLSVGLLVSGLAFANPERPPVNINTADQATLSAVHGIGKHKAKAIVEYRQQHGAFKEVHDLTLIKGFTEKNLQNILKRNPGELTVKS
jgi:competence protein ComEA